MDEATRKLIAELSVAATEALRQHEVLTLMLDGLNRAASALDDAAQEAEERSGRPLRSVS